MMKISPLKISISAVCSTVIFCLAGCVSPVYDTLLPIPEYPRSEQKFDTNAVIQLIPSADSRVASAILTELAQKEYANVITDGHYMEKTPGTIHILTPLSFNFTVYNCQEGKYLEARLIVSLRQPGFVWMGQFYGKNSRYFQAFSRSFIGFRELMSTDYDEEIKTVVSNLFSIDDFRTALNPQPQNSAVAGAVNTQQAWNKLLAAIRSDDKAEIIRWAFIASENGDKRADALLAAYAVDSDNICGDFKRLAKLLLRLAENGVPTAQTKLAQLYSEGKGVPYSLENTFFWYSKAANQGVPDAQYQVGKFCENGIGTAKNFQLAMYWYQQAANRKYQPAIDRLNEIKQAQQKKD
ncbi:MAG: sel1 repeat family protein [Lentisphaerae bacterium]|nr:sel1 repeat family protein [Lentisphaerota bacterium]